MRRTASEDRNRPRLPSLRCWGVSCMTQENVPGPAPSRFRAYRLPINKLAALYLEHNGGLVRIAFRIQSDLAGDAAMILRPGYLIANLLAVGRTGPFDSLEEHHWRVVAQTSKRICNRVEASLV